MERSGVGASLVFVCNIFGDFVVVLLGIVYLIRVVLIVEV